MAKKTTKTEEKSIVKAVDATFQQENETVETRVEFEIQKFNIADAKIAELKNQFKDLEIQDVNDKNGIKAVTEAISIMRNLRTGLEKKRKELKDFYLSTGKGIDAEAKRIQELIADVEEPLKAKKDAIDAEIQRIKDEEEAREAKRIEDRVDALKAAGIVFDGTFYSIGESVSVDLLTIKDLDEEAFEKLKSMVQAENEKIQAKKHIDELHENRKEHLLQFWSFLTEEQRQMNFGELTNEAFMIIVFEAQQASENFEAEKQKQADEAQKLIDDRKVFNYERRSFKLEKEGFTVSKRDGSLDFTNEAIRIIFKKDELESLGDVEFEALFNEHILLKNNSEKEVLKISEKREADAREKAAADAQEAVKNERLAMLDKINGATKDLKYLNYTNSGVLISSLLELSDSEFAERIVEIRKEIADFDRAEAENAEQERLAKLPDLDKIERYCNEIMGVSVPQLASKEAQKELQLLRSELKLSVEKTLSNIQLLK